MDNKILLFGFIGSGKSTLANALSNDFKIIELDQINKNILEPGGLGNKALFKQIGNSYFNPDNSLKKDMLKQEIFFNKDFKIKIEKILHPLIYEEVQKIIMNLDQFIIVAPLVKKITKRIVFNKTVMLTCNSHELIKRVQLRDGLSNEVIKKIIESQAEDYKSVTPDLMIDSSLALETQKDMLKNQL